MNTTTTQITVRNVDATLKHRITKLAKLKSISINDLVLETLRAKVSLDPTHPPVANWSHYKGAMDTQAFDQAVLDDFEAIDWTMWADPAAPHEVKGQKTGDRR